MECVVTASFSSEVSPIVSERQREPPRVPFSVAECPTTFIEQEGRDCFVGYMCVCVLLYPVGFGKGGSVFSKYE